MTGQADVQDLMHKYKQRLAQELHFSPEELEKPVFSREYQQFKKEYLPKRLSVYEKACNFSEKVLRLKPDSKKALVLEESIRISHLDISPSGSLSFAVLGPLVFMLFGSLVAFAFFQSLFFVVLCLIAGLSMIFPFMNLPNYIADNWRMKASNQMVICIFYVVTFMRHTSNLEKAIEFASEHLSPPLALDLKKVLWDVETERYESVKESLDMYLETWRKWNMEFVESFHLVESSLYEPSDERRLELLDKSLDVILTETYEKMLHYAHNLQSPITMLHMLGVILPILGLVILPLVVSFIGEVQWYHLAVLYNMILPVGVYFLGKSILSKRPTGYGDTDISEANPELKKLRYLGLKLGSVEFRINPLVIAVGVFVVLFLLGISPLVLHLLGFSDFGFFGVDPDNESCGMKFCFLGYRMSKATEGPTVGQIIGPFGLGAAVMSLFITLSFGLSVGVYHRVRSTNVIKIRNKAKELEDEFASGLFQLGSRLGDGLPAEISFGKVAGIMQDSVTGQFFALVDANIRRLGMSVKDSIFDPQVGALRHYPSKLISSSMKVLIQSLRKGPKVAAVALMNISRYVKEIHKVNERLKDLMADVITSMKSQISFMTPVIAGIVVGITSMITTILGALGSRLGKINAQNVGAGAAAPQLDLFTLLGDGIPTFYFQLVVGLYVVQIIYILTVLSNGIENGADKLAERYSLGKNLIRSTLLYFFVSMAIMTLFNIIAGRVVAFTVGG